MSTAPIAVVNYGMGNIRSVLNALQEVGSGGELISDPEMIARRGKLILPGVGAFGEAMNNLKRSAIDQSLDRARRAGALILGICLGMQLLLGSSEESTASVGLNWISGRVLKFPSHPNLRVPHMGWNDLHFERDHALTHGVNDGSDVYFLHSYFCACDDNRDVLATSTHGVSFAAMLARDNLFGIQFHPEKSQQPGLAMLRNFARL